jgi:8-oxo-dGTP pyrophosphatase MutT (NUDIX family)
MGICGTHPVTEPGSSLRIRPATRALVISPRPAVLLVRFEFPAGSRWALPGGGLEPDEDHATALRRELREEVGLRDVEIGPHIWTREHIFPFINGLWDGQREHIFAVPVADEFDPSPEMTWAELNAEYVFEVRWWSVDDIRRADAITWSPSGLPGLLEEIVRTGFPGSPIDVAP